VKDGIKMVIVYRLGDIYKIILSEYGGALVREEKYKNMKLYTCDSCNLGYGNRETAKECENFCRTYNSCSMEIAKKAIKRD